jgi:[ribosomal protein S5]-alanine N-acetyltransferase
MFPELATHRLLLTRIRAADAADVLDLFSSEQVVQYYDIGVLASLAEAEALIQRLSRRFESRDGIRWAIRLSSSPELVGTCGFNSWSTHTHSAVIGYDLKVRYWGQGLVFEALSAILDCAFQGRLACGRVNRIQADTVPGNLRSEAVLTRLGFREEGLRRQSGYWKDAYHDMKCFGLLKSDHELRVAGARGST